MKWISLAGLASLIWLVSASALLSQNSPGPALKPVPPPEFPAPYNTEPDASGPMPARDAAAKMELPPGFKTTVFATEPDVQNPIAMAWDARGRLWVAENYTYAERARRFDLHLRDRILIFEDTDGDGHFDKRTVFSDELQFLTSLAIGYGGVWVTCPPKVLFIPDRNGDDVPDGVPETVLDGFAIPAENYHTLANGLRFGPDGWLYGRCGASSVGEIGIPGCPPEQRIPLRGTLWRFHPQRKVVEVLSSGTTNPWGHDWDENGELFFINTVNGHLWHDFAGAHYTRPHTIDPNPHVYALIDQHADHWHFDTSHDWSQSRDGAANAYGGGHAHVGMMIYLADNWPAEYRGHLFTLNLHGRRMNQDILERTGSGYVGRHGRDFMIAADPWFRGMELSYGPDGGVFVLDWSDTGECHESTGVHRTSGRIFKISYGSPAPARFDDFRKQSTAALVELQRHSNEWFTRQARIELAARHSDGRGTDAAHGDLMKMFQNQTDSVLALKALWSLYVTGSADFEFLRAQLHHPNEHVRAWAIRLLTDFWPLDTALSSRPLGRAEAIVDAGLLQEFCTLARTDPSGLVRLVLASTIQRLPLAKRSELAAALASRREDANDHNLPLLIWYGLIPLGDSDPESLAAMAAKCELPMTRKCIARRLTEEVDKNPSALNTILRNATSTGSEEFIGDILSGMSEALKGWRRAAKPAAWEMLTEKCAEATNRLLRAQVRELSVVFGDGRALDEVKRTALDSHADLTIRKAALETLIENRLPELRTVCESLIRVEFLNPIAARGLATFDDPSIAEDLVKAYRQFHPTERPQLIGVLVSRPTFVRTLLGAIGDGKIPKAALSPFHARQIQSYNDESLNTLLKKVWGAQRETAADKQEFITKLKTQLTAAALSKADLKQGHAVFQTVCAICHRLYGEGGDVGPDLTGSGRDNLDFLLSNIVDPSAVVNADFKMSIVNLKDGRVFNGFIRAKSDRTLTLQAMTEQVVINRNDISAIDDSALSLMPEGLLDALTESQVRDLMAFLMRR